MLLPVSIFIFFKWISQPEYWPLRIQHLRYQATPGNIYVPQFYENSAILARHEGQWWCWFKDRMNGPLKDLDKQVSSCHGGYVCGMVGMVTIPGMVLGQGRQGGC